MVAQTITLGDTEVRRLGMGSNRLEHTPKNIEFVRAARDAGKIRHVGISEVDVGQIERARAVVPIAAVQNLYNLAERGHDDVIDHCAEQGIVFVPYFPLRGKDAPAVAEIAERHGKTASQ